MKNIALESMLQLVSQLSYTDTKRLNNAIKNKLSSDVVGKAVADSEDSVCECPYCQSPEFIKHGVTPKGLQRYRCKECKATFTSLTHTPLNRMRKRDKWLDYVELMWDGTPLRSIAARLGITLRTAFFWRHRFLQMPCKNQPTSFNGIIEADEAFLPESFKGRRVISHRKPRKRGGGKVPLVPFLISYQRGEQFTFKVLERNDKQNLSDAITPLLTDGCCLCTDGNVTYKSIVNGLKINLDHKRVIAQDGRVVDGVYHIQHVNGFIANFKIWVERFKGVGTAYLGNYLAWYIWMQGKGYGKENLWIKEALG